MSVRRPSAPSEKKEPRGLRPNPRAFFSPSASVRLSARLSPRKVGFVKSRAVAGWGGYLKTYRLAGACVGNSPSSPHVLHPFFHLINAAGRFIFQFLSLSSFCPPAAGERAKQKGERKNEKDDGR